MYSPHTARKNYAKSKKKKNNHKKNNHMIIPIICQNSPRQQITPSSSNLIEFIASFTIIILIGYVMFITFWPSNVNIIYSSKKANDEIMINNSRSSNETIHIEHLFNSRHPLSVEHLLLPDNETRKQIDDALRLILMHKTMNFGLQRKEYILQKELIGKFKDKEATNKYSSMHGYDHWWKDEQKYYDTISRISEEFSSSPLENVRKQLKDKLNILGITLDNKTMDNIINEMEAKYPTYDVLKYFQSLVFKQQPHITKIKELMQLKKQFIKTELPLIHAKSWKKTEEAKDKQIKMGKYEMEEIYWSAISQEILQCKVYKKLHDATNQVLKNLVLYYQSKEKLSKPLGPVQLKQKYGINPIGMTFEYVTYYIESATNDNPFGKNMEKRAYVFLEEMNHIGIRIMDLGILKSHFSSFMFGRKHDGSTFIRYSNLDPDSLYWPLFKEYSEFINFFQDPQAFGEFLKVFDAINFILDLAKIIGFDELHDERKKNKNSGDISQVTKALQTMDDAESWGEFLGSAKGIVLANLVWEGIWAVIPCTETFTLYLIAHAYPPAEAAAAALTVCESFGHYVAPIMISAVLRGCFSRGAPQMKQQQALLLQPHYFEFTHFQLDYFNISLFIGKQFEDHNSMIGMHYTVEKYFGKFAVTNSVYQNKLWTITCNTYTIEKITIETEYVEINFGCGAIQYYSKGAAFIILRDIAINLGIQVPSIVQSSLIMNYDQVQLPSVPKVSIPNIKRRPVTNK